MHTCNMKELEKALRTISDCASEANAAVRIWRCSNARSEAMKLLEKMLNKAEIPVNEANMRDVSGLTDDEYQVYERNLHRDMDKLFTLS